MWWPKRNRVKSPLFKRWWFKWGLRFAVLFLAITILPVMLYAVVDPPTTPLMWIRWMENDSGKQYPLFAREWRPLNEISPRLVRAVISSEDQKFFAQWFRLGSRGQRLRGKPDNETKNRRQHDIHADGA